MENQTILLFFPRVNTDNTRFMPFSVLHLERMIRDIGFNIVLLDEQINGSCHDVIEAHAGRLFMAVTTAATGYQIKGAVDFTRKVKEVCPAAHTLWCGWHTSLMPELTLKEPNIDFVISGQAEMPFKELVGALASNTSYENIAGLGFKKEGLLHTNPQGEFIDINTFPDIDYSLIEPEKYIFTNSFSKRCITYFASHGCPFRCGFCSLATVFCGKWYPKTIDGIIKDIKTLKERAGLDGISFWDDNFFTRRDFSLALAQAFIDNRIDLKWECCTHAGLFNKNFTATDVELFHKSGLRQIFTGAESGDDDILKLVGKHILKEDNFTFVRKLKPTGIVPVFLIIVCFPVDPDKDLRETLDMIRKAKLLNPKLKIRLHIFVPAPRTKMFEIALEKGLYMPEKLEDYSYFLYRFKPPWIKKDYRWALETFVNFYLPLANPGLYKEAPTTGLKALTLLLSIFCYPVVYLRFRFNFFAIPVGAYVFISLLRLFNKIFSTHLSLGTESYLAKNNLGFYNSYCG